MRFPFSFSFEITKTFLGNMFPDLVPIISLSQLRNMCNPLWEYLQSHTRYMLSLPGPLSYNHKLEMLDRLLTPLHCLASMDRTEGEDIRIKSLRVSIHLLAKGHLVNSKTVVCFILLFLWEFWILILNTCSKPRKEVIQ